MNHTIIIIIINTDRFGHNFRVNLRKIFYDVKWTELANTGSIDRLLW